MRNFFKIFFASFLALTVFSIVAVVIVLGVISLASSNDEPTVKSKTVLVFDVSQPLMEQPMETGFNFPEGTTPSLGGLYQTVMALHTAATDSAVKGIYLVGGSNPNGFATTDELRHALLRFKKSGKFIIAYANYMDQRFYELANVATDIYLNPVGSLEWQGFGMQMAFFKDALDKLEVKPEIFYAGQFKSATEPLRLSKMSDANRKQLQQFIEQHYSQFQQQVSEARGLDTSKVRQLATALHLRIANDAVQENLIDKLMYDDEVKAMIAKRVGAAGIDKINFMPMSDYVKVDRPDKKSDQKIALLYAQGDIVDGKGADEEIGGERFRQLIRKARLDKNIKAMVLRVNSPGGSAVASEVILRELQLFQKEKPLVVSMGDYAASGGYYISCSADSIFAQPNTLTGSIGVFSILFDATKLMSTKLGITFDEVNTSPSASLGSPFRSLLPAERDYLQQSVNNTYGTFKNRVAAGRNLPEAWVDSIGQGRIWSGTDALQNKLVDKLGNIQDAIACAARLAKIKDYTIKEWPEQQSFWEKLFSKSKPSSIRASGWMQQQMGVEFYTAWKHMQQLKQQQGKIQMRLPFFILPNSRAN